MTAYDLGPILRECDALLIVPPFAGIDRPAIGVHILQACARRAGLRVSVLYANLLLAAFIGESAYEGVCYAPTYGLIGERLFARAAYGVAPFGLSGPGDKKRFRDRAWKTASEEEGVELDIDELLALEAGMPAWASDVASAIVEACRAPVVGASTTFEQTAASVALLDRIKARRPDAVAILGGGNCEGEMAAGMLTLGSGIDHVFSGECEACFPAFLGAVLAGERPASRIVEGAACADLDSLPTPDFTEYFEQRERARDRGREAVKVWLPYECSRGCWWGEKHHCTFCGLNGETMRYREKSPDRVIADLSRLHEQHGVERICMVDNIMPHRYFRTLLPRVAGELPPLRIFFEQKANLTLAQMRALHAAGIVEIQPGIEALSTGLLDLMDKGISARQNIALLRYAQIAEVTMNWNLLYGFPGDRAEWYEETLRVLPLIRHLQPPTGLCHLSIDRFSPYFFAPERYGITNVRPMPGYAAVLPAGADVARIAYHFIADYETAARSAGELVRATEREVAAWRAVWREGSTPPVLSITALSSDQLMLTDTRGLIGTRRVRFLDRAKARAALVAERRCDGPEARWAIDAKLAVELDGWCVPLATAPADLVEELEAEASRLAKKGGPEATRRRLAVLETA